MNALGLTVLCALCCTVLSQNLSSISANLSTMLTIDGFSTGYRSAAQLNLVYEGNFNSSVGTAARGRYFNCVQKDATGNVVFPIGPRDTMSAITVGFQMPILLFLDYEVREGLMNAFAQAVSVPVAELCIYRVQQYVPGYFNESVFVTIFRRNSAVSLLTAFDAGYSETNGSTVFLGKSAWNLGMSTLYTNGMVPHAVNLTVPPPQNDLAVSPAQIRRHAFIVYSGAGNVNMFDVVKTESFKLRLAENPNAINFYLEGGDYAFIIIGSILVFSILVLLFFGYVWNPLD